jgi:hypothetical protein
MQADGVIGHYAIGGAVGATFYLEPTATYDIDIFISVPVSLSPIYQYLIEHGCKVGRQSSLRKPFQKAGLEPPSTK